MALWPGLQRAQLVKWSRDNYFSRVGSNVIPIWKPGFSPMVKTPRCQQGIRSCGKDAKAIRSQRVLQKKRRCCSEGEMCGSKGKSFSSEGKSFCLICFDSQAFMGKRWESVPGSPGLMAGLAYHVWVGMHLLRHSESDEDPLLARKQLNNRYCMT